MSRAVERRLGPEIKRRREEKGLSIRALSKIVGLDAGAISQIERSLRQPNESTVERIASGLDTTPAELLGENQEDQAVEFDWGRAFESALTDIESKVSEAKLARLTRKEASELADRVVTLARTALAVRDMGKIGDFHADRLNKRALNAAIDLFDVSLGRDSKSQEIHAEFSVGMGELEEFLSREAS